MDNYEPVRWMVSFWHPAGGSKEEPDFPRVEFWHPDKQSARVEAARVLIELREGRGDERGWVAAGHPDPFEVGVGRHPGGQFILRYGDLKQADKETGRLAEERLRGMRAADGAWQGIVGGGGTEADPPGSSPNWLPIRAGAINRMEYLVDSDWAIDYMHGIEEVVQSLDELAPPEYHIGGRAL